MAETSSDWAQKADRLVKTFTFDTFPAAMAFMVEVAVFCDKNDHHPEWKNNYNKVFVELTTHDEGGVTHKDTELARHMDEVFARKPGNSGIV